MMDYKIVRDPALLGGRWHLDGLMLPIADIRNDYHHWHDGPLDTYRFAGVSSEVIAAVLAFAFPAVREASIQLSPAAVVLLCECGEEVGVITGGDPVTDIRCVCDRVWTARLIVERKATDGRAASG